MLDAADDEADETKDRRCAEGKSPPGGVGAAIDAYIHISHTSAIGWLQCAGLRLKSAALAFLFCPSA